MSWNEQQDEFEAAADEVAREYETRLRDELELALEREESLTQEKIAALEGVKKTSGRPGTDEPEPVEKSPTGMPVGPREAGYQRVMGTFATANSRSIGSGATIAFIFVSYPLGGALLGWLINKWWIEPRYGEPSWIPFLVCIVLGFYNGIIEMLRYSRRLEREANERRDEQKRRTR